MENEITIKIILSGNTPINKQLYIDIINGLNDRYVPCDEIYLNNNLVFSTTNGFINKEEDKKDDI